MNNSKSKKAIEVLKNQIQKLRSTSIQTVWITETKAMIKIYLGEESDFYRSSDRLYHFPSDAKIYLETCIAHIEKFGVYHKPNWFFKRTVGEILSMVAIFQALLFTIVLPFTCNQGRIQGAADSKDKIHKLESERDSFKRLVPIVMPTSDNSTQIPPHK